MASAPENTQPNHLLQNRINILDGFRGVAVILVLLYHYLPFFSFGWVGVDLFFVLSGFLITGKLIESLGSKKYFLSFYCKRLLRIVPLYYLILLLLFVLLPAALPSFVSGSVNQLFSQQWHYWFFTVNIHDAFNGWPDNVTLVPLWSLACEMQFYLFWPFVVLLFYRPSNNKFITVLIVFIAAAILFRLFGNAGHYFSSAFSYVLLPARLDAFSIGAMLYIFVNDERFARLLKTGWKISVVCLALILVVVFCQGGSWHLDDMLASQAGYTLNALFWGGLMGSAIQGNNGFRRFFSNGWLMNAGKYSYAIYILHVPVKVVLLKFSGGPSTASGSYYLIILVAAVATILFSIISFHLIEKRFLRLKTHV